MLTDEQRKDLERARDAVRKFKAFLTGGKQNQEAAQAEWESNEAAYDFVNNHADTLLAGGWVSVEERLPEGFAWVLAYYDGMMATMLYEPERGFYGQTANSMETFASGITHWRELPAPPQESKN